LTHEIHGRRKPYTERGVRRLPCVRCGEPAATQWSICADGNVHRPICVLCDIALNHLVLSWSGIPGWERKAKEYARKMRREHGLSTSDYD